MNHNIVNYAEMVEALAKRGEDSQAGLTPGKSHLLHMAVGVSGESGELLDAIKNIPSTAKSWMFPTLSRNLATLNSTWKACANTLASHAKQSSRLTSPN